MAYKGCFLETTLEREEGINNKVVLLFMIFGFSLPKLIDETVQNGWKSKGWE